MEYAVIETSGKQFLVEPGDLIEINQILDEPGSKIVFDKVLLHLKEGEPNIGTPYLDMQVTAKVLEHVREKKKVGMKYQRSGYRRKFGHRQPKTVIEIDAIS